MSSKYWGHVPDHPAGALAFIAEYKISLDYYDDEWTASYHTTSECNLGSNHTDYTHGSGEDIATALYALYKAMCEEGIIEDD